MALASRSLSPDHQVGAPSSVRRQRPSLRVVPRQRRAVGAVVAITSFVALAMLGAAASQVYLAQGQLSIDQLDRQIRETSARYEALRLERAELRSPGRLQAVAEQWGLQPDGNATFMMVGADVVATMRQSSALLDPAYGSEEELLEQFRTVKALQAVAP